jgi:hypothetical protein
MRPQFFNMKGTEAVEHGKGSLAVEASTLLHLGQRRSEAMGYKRALIPGAIKRGR